MKTVVFSVILSAIVAYGVSTKVARNAYAKHNESFKEEVLNEVNLLTSIAVDEVKSEGRFRAEQFADLNTRCYFHSNQIDDVEHMTVNNSKEIRAAQKDINDIIKILTSMRNRK